MTTAELEAIKKRHAATTPGPWEYEAKQDKRDRTAWAEVLTPDGKVLFDTCNGGVVQLEEDHSDGSTYRWDETGRKNLTFAAAAWQDVRDLVAEVARLQKLTAPKMFPIQSERGAAPHPIRIPWEVAELAYSVYSARYGRSQSLDELARRGGFGPSEMDTYYPGWRHHCTMLTRHHDLVHKALKLCRELQSPAMEYLNPHVQTAWSDLLNFLEGKPNEKVGSDQ